MRGIRVGTTKRAHQTVILLNRNSHLSPPWGWPVEPKEDKQAGILKKRIQFDT